MLKANLATVMCVLAPTTGKVGVTILLTLVILVGEKSAFAINNGENDQNNQFPNVGTFVLDFGGNPFQACSGTLIDDRVFLTAAHCVAGIEQDIAAGDITAEDVYVSFDPNDPFDSNTWLSVEYMLIHPEYSGGPPLHNDVALAFLADDVVGITPAELAPVGYLDALSDDGTLSKRSHAEFTVVGYGLERSFPERVFDDPGGIRRRFATAEFQNLEPNTLHLNQVQAPGVDNGGTCSGDSGGPGFWTESDGTRILTSVTSWGDFECVATDKRQRIDIPSVQAFLDTQLGTALSNNSIAAVPEPTNMPWALIAMSLLAIRRRIR